MLDKNLIKCSIKKNILVHKRVRILKRLILAFVVYLSFIPPTLASTADLFTVNVNTFNLIGTRFILLRYENDLFIRGKRIQ